MGKQGKKKRIWLRVLLGILAALLLVIIGYVLYVMISYHRLPDDLTLDVRTPENADTTGAVSVGTDYEIITYNIGFGAYTPDYSFFMNTSCWISISADITRILPLIMIQRF